MSEATQLLSRLDNPQDWEHQREKALGIAVLPIDGTWVAMWICHFCKNGPITDTEDNDSCCDPMKDMYKRRSMENLNRRRRRR